MAVFAATTNNALMGIHEYIYLLTFEGVSVGQIPRSGLKIMYSIGPTNRDLKP